MINPIEHIKKAVSNHKIQGSWLVTGGYDYEKVYFIKRVCSLLLNQNLNSFNTYSPDVKWVECGLTEEAKKEIQKTILAGKAVDEDKEFSKKREITVEDIREGIQFLSLKGVGDKWRILIIHPADKMNENAANALLKILEEPPEQAIIFLLCQNLGKLLPTIKSRCRKITLPMTDEAQLKSQLLSDYPTIENIDEVVALSNGSVGLAKDICDNNGVALYRELETLFQPADRLSVETVKSFIDDLTPNGFDLVKLFILDRISAQFKKYALSAPFLAEDWMDLYQEADALFQDIDRIYLDKKQVLQTVIYKIAGLIHD